MTGTSSQHLFHQAAESEAGMPISAGARVAQVRHAADGGRGWFLDLSSVPEHLRAALIAEIKELVNKAASNPAMPQTQAQPRIVEPS